MESSTTVAHLSANADQDTCGEPPVERRSNVAQAVVYLFVIGPVVALIAAIVLAILGNGITWLDFGLAAFMYIVSVHGTTIGFHRYFTHKSFKANRPLKIALAVTGSLAVEGSVTEWVAQHRKHHQFADAEGDPHSPWRFGTSPMAVLKGLWWAQCGWLFDRRVADIVPKYAPDLQADKDIQKVTKHFGWIIAFSIAFPPLFAFAVTGGNWMAGLTALLWASFVRMLLVHHVTWSTNSICHMFGDRPFKSRDKATNFWPLALLTMGEAWHNLHHADPTSARMGVDRFQIDSSARLIWVFEKFGWATDVRWPSKARLDSKRAV